MGGTEFFKIFFFKKIVKTLRVARTYWESCVKVRDLNTLFDDASCSWTNVTNVVLSTGSISSKSDYGENWQNSKLKYN